MCLGQILYRAARRGTLVRAMLGRELFCLEQNGFELEFHGSGYGGWAILGDSLDAHSIVYSLGVGKDVSFDLAIIGKYGCNVFAYDPTPRAVAFVAENVRDQRFRMHACAVAEREGQMKLSSPPRHMRDQISCSAHAGDASGDSFEVPCTTVNRLWMQNNHSRCDVLKMDIEGCEFAVIDQGIRDGWIRRVDQLMVEFHHFLPGCSIAQVRRAVAQLKQAGFSIAWISRTNHEYLFVHSRRPAAR